VKNNKYRFVYFFIIGLFNTILLKVLVFSRMQNGEHPLLYDFILTTICTMVVWEGNLQIDNYLNKYYSWFTNGIKRLLIQLPFALLFSLSFIFTAMFFYGKLVCSDSPNHARLTIDSLIISAMLVFVIMAIELSMQFFKGWKNSLIEVEKYKTQNAQAQLENLKTQINPHFLFNNMSVLSSLVYKDQDKAVDFIQQLSKVYRYVLDNRNNELVAVQTEIEFVESYIYLLQIRFDKNIIFEIAINDIEKHKMIPPMCLQILVENCIKHNEISAQHPLSISIKSSDSTIEVSNHLQLRINPEPSAKMGLQNIIERYQYLSDSKVVVSQENNKFTVSLPLLQKI
jgi:two-component system, LytTR family, sensor kinase